MYLILSYILIELYILFNDLTANDKNIYKKYPHVKKSY